MLKYIYIQIAITDLVEHPVPIPPVIDTSANPTTTVRLTPKERYGFISLMYIFLQFVIFNNTCFYIIQ
jgi:hypothetical protein